MAFFNSKVSKTRSNLKKELTFKKQLFFGVLRLVGIVVFFVFVYHVTRLSAVTLEEVTVAGGETISHDEIRNRVTDELQGTYFLIIPKRFVVLYPHDRIIAVLEKIPRVHNIEIKRTSLTAIDVTFEEYIPHALWCMSLSEDQTCYFMTDDGYAFAPAPRLNGGTLTRHNIEGMTEISEGTVIDPETLHAIDVFIERVEKEKNAKHVDFIDESGRKAVERQT